MKAIAASTFVVATLGTKILRPAKLSQSKASEASCTQEEIKAAVVPASVEISDLSQYSFDCVKFDDSFVHGGTHLPRASQLVGIGSDFSYAGFEWTVSNGSSDVTT